jgi:hypothetical protein
MCRWRFDESLKKYLNKAKPLEHPFRISLSDLDINPNNINTSSSLSDDEFKRNVKDKLNGLLHLRHQKKFRTMALNDKMVSSDNNASNGDSNPEVPLSTHEMATKIDTLYVSLMSWGKFLKYVTCERNELKAKLETTLKNLESPRVPIMFQETECGHYVMHMSNLSTLQTKYAFVTPLVLLSLKLEHNIMSISISCVCHT